MHSKSLALSSPELLAEYVLQSELQGFLEKRFAAPPDHAAILIRDGRVVDTYKGAHFSIGGVLRGLLRFATGAQNVRVLLADLKPFSIQSPVRAITKDAVEVAGVVTLELQVDPDEPQNVMGLISPVGHLTRTGILERFRPHLADRVFESVLRQIEARELRGHTGVQDLLQGSVMRELERIAGNIGLTVRAVSAEWALSEVEREEMRYAQIDRQQDALDRSLEWVKRGLERNADAAEVQLKTSLDLTKLQLDSDDEIERLVLAREVELLDARESAQRRQELEALGHEIEVLQTERAARIENELAEAGQQIDLNRYRRALTRVNLEIEAMRATHAAEMRKLGAFAELDIDERQRTLELDVNGRAQRQSLEHIAGLQEIENSTAAHEARLAEEARNGQSRREVDAVRAEADARVAQMQAGANMSAEQVLAVNAGLSKDVAAVLVERARAEGGGHEQALGLMREMVSQATEARVASEAQAREMFRMGIDGAVGVARHTGGGQGADADPGAQVSASATAECPTCSRVNPAKARFCVGCGHQLRT
ncbi:MAG: hypothetical protein GY711_06820 [bacterium]|nr:hypothetical protein [bacterium]